jgi:hypothetical protein
MSVPLPAVSPFGLYDGPTEVHRHAITRQPIRNGTTI